MPKASSSVGKGGNWTPAATLRSIEQEKNQYKAVRQALLNQISQNYQYLNYGAVYGGIKIQTPKQLISRSKESLQKIDNKVKKIINKYPNRDEGGQLSRYSKLIGEVSKLK